MVAANTKTDVAVKPLFSGHRVFEREGRKKVALDYRVPQGGRRGRSVILGRLPCVSTGGAGRRAPPTRVNMLEGE